jgi:hypothetical protein
MARNPLAGVLVASLLLAGCNGGGHHSTAPTSTDAPSSSATTLTTSVASTGVAGTTAEDQALIAAYRNGVTAWIALAEEPNGVPSDPGLAKYFGDPLLQGIRQYLASLRERGHVLKGQWNLRNVGLDSNDGTTATLHDCYTHGLDEYAIASGVQDTHIGLVKTSEQVTVVKGADGLWRAQFTTSTKDGPWCAG